MSSQLPHQDIKTLEETKNIEPNAIPTSPFIKLVNENLKKTITKNEFETPAFPPVVTEVMKLFKNPHTGIAQIEKAIQQDQVITSGIIRAANSPMFKGVAEIKSLTNAMSRIGLRSIKDIVIAVGAQKVFHIPGAEDFSKPILTHSLACAGIAQHLATKFSLSADDAFLGGLFHDIGKLVLVRLAIKLEEEEREKAKQIAKKAYRPFDAKPFTIPDMKASILTPAFHEFHSVVGKTVVQKWNLEGSVAMDLVHHHHDFSKAPETTRSLAMAVQNANLICHHAGLGCPVNPIEFSSWPSFNEMKQSPEQLNTLISESVQAGRKFMEL